MVTTIEAAELTGHSQFYLAEMARRRKIPRAYNDFDDMWQLPVKWLPKKKRANAMNDVQAGEKMKALATEAVGVVWAASAGEMSRRVTWGRFVKNLPHDHILLELADECFKAMTKEQRRQFLAGCAHKPVAPGVAIVTQETYPKST